MYKDDFENIQQKYKLFPFTLRNVSPLASKVADQGPQCESCRHFSSVDKTKIPNSAENSFPPAEIRLSVNLFCKITRVPVAFYLNTS